ncbi:hypothetical protein EXIGLDRAFT_843280 [Exidia glandulosa HHB12029]|uniref:Putative ER transporter 6TM N-terminal domain-containing protein n=1 Tax=Exidia glandulosa HHB12029 TaxID=1314781 RepID=A0A165CS56_EXIGL|nr:hypothetical protein EXIGLDRAFT_843280 [Exidia glandulosa HHB12029]
MLMSALHSVRRVVFSTQFVPVLKGALTYTIALSLIMVRGFTDLSEYPPALASMLILTIAGNTGGPIGSTLQAAFLATTGVAVGGLGFLVLAHLHESHTAQGFVFFIFVYVAALIRARGFKWFGFSLFSVLMAFNGIYTSVLLNGFSAAYLRAYLKAYAWGVAIGLVVNLLIWPRSSEQDLRQTLVLSLEHIGTFAQLLSKTYTMTITEEEKEVRDKLAQSLRADFGLLNQKIADTSVEINFSKYSMSDYTHFVGRTRALQIAAISAYSSLLSMEGKDGDLFKSHFLPSTRQSFLVFRRSVEITLKEIMAALADKPLDDYKNRPGHTEVDLEEQRGVGQGSIHDGVTGTMEGLSAELQRAEKDIDVQLRAVSRRLETEVDGANDESAAHSSVPSSRPATDNVQPVTEKLDAHDVTPPTTATTFGVERIAPTFEKFALVQQHILSEILATGALHGSDQKLRLHLPQPSLHAAWGIGTGGTDTPRTTVPRQHSELDLLLGRPDERTPEEEKEEAEQTANHHSLLRVYSFIFAMRIYVQQLERYHREAVRFESRTGKPAPRRLQFRLFQHLANPHKTTLHSINFTPPQAKFAGSPVEDPVALADEADERDLGFKEAMALLEQRTYTPQKKTLLQRLKQIERAARSPTSIFALKTAAGAIVFAMLLFATTTRAFFIKYSLTGGLLTLMVSISPTLGQSLLAFVLQIAGSGLGYLWGVALLEMFRGVGGYAFNPFGIVAMIFVSSLPFFYLIYYYPKFFVFSLLALNSTGVLVVSEWIYVEYWHRPFDTPIFRAGKAITALGIALGIAVVFQVFILRNPARRTLRKALAGLTYSMLSYYTLFHAYVQAVVPVALDEYRPPRSAIMRLEKELKRREWKMQKQLIDMIPLLIFAAAEVDFISPFRADLAAKIMRCHQTMLDRLKEARSVIGVDVVPDIITREFSARLYAYRRRNIRLAKASLYTCAASLASKAPLPGETPAKLLMTGNVGDFLHDAMLISSHISRTEEGKEAIMNGELTRYWAYVMTITSLSEQLITLEETCHELCGDLDATLL